MPTIRNIDVIRALRPENAGLGETVLRYVELFKLLKVYALDARERAARARSTKLSSLEQAGAVRQLAFYNLLLCAEKGLLASHQPARELWAERFTQASITIYGAPDLAEVQTLVNQQYRQFRTYKKNKAISQVHLDTLLAAYEPMVTDHDPIVVDQAQLVEERATLAAYGQVIKARYGPIFEMANQADYSSPELAGLFSKALDWLAQHDDADWSEWRAVQRNGTSLRVLTTQKAIKIAKQRPSADKATAQALLAHELLVHALRSKNGHKTSDTRVANGIVGYTESEEGLGIVAQSAITGTIPLRLVDRYVGIAFALGTLNGRQMSRPELFKICYARQLINEQNSATKAIDETVIARAVWGSVDRIYRGGRGDQVTQNQAIFTKDIAYYQGYRKMVDYITRELKTGKSAAVIFDYLSRGKFDPTNAQHVALVDSLAKPAARPTADLPI